MSRGAEVLAQWHIAPPDGTEVTGETYRTVADYLERELVVEDDTQPEIERALDALAALKAQVTHFERALRRLATKQQQG